MGGKEGFHTHTDDFSDYHLFVDFCDKDIRKFPMFGAPCVRAGWFWPCYFGPAAMGKFAVREHTSQLALLAPVVSSHNGDISD